MAVESTTKISGLNAAWPLGTDIKSEGDNHLRLIKSTLQAVFDDSGTTLKTTLPLEVPDIKRTAGAQAVGSVVTTVVTTSGTYAKPAGLVSLEIWVIGGGGGGGVAAAGGANQSSSGGGGGAGAVVYNVYQASALAASVAYTVGAGGVGGNGSVQIGGSGGNSSFAGLTAGGGSGGNWMALSPALGASTPGGAGGVGSGGALNLAGGDGGAGIANPHNRAGVGLQGTGGVNMFGQAYATNMSVGAAAGLAGRFPGGGGVGSAASGSGGVTNGGAGAGGGIIFKEHY